MLCANWFTYALKLVLHIRWELPVQLRGSIFGRFSKSICDIINSRTSYQLNKISVIKRGAHEEILFRKRRHSHDHASSFCTLDREEWRQTVQCVSGARRDILG